MKQIFALFLGGFIIWLLFIRKKTTAAKVVASSVPGIAPPIKRINDVILTAPEQSLVNPAKTANENIAALIQSQPTAVDIIYQRMNDNNDKSIAISTNTIENVIKQVVETQKNMDAQLSTGNITQDQYNSINQIQDEAKDQIAQAKIALDQVNLLKLKDAIPTRVFDQRIGWRGVIDANNSAANAYKDNPTLANIWLNSNATYQRLIDDFTATYDNNPKYIIYS